MPRRLRVFTERGPIDYDVQRVDVAPSGDLTLYSIKDTGERNLDPSKGPVGAMAIEQKLLAIIGPDGSIRAETVEVPDAGEESALIPISNGRRAK